MNGYSIDDRFRKSSWFLVLSHPRYRSDVFLGVPSSKLSTWPRDPGSWCAIHSFSTQQALENLGFSRCWSSELRFSKSCTNVKRRKIRKRLHLKRAHWKTNNQQHTPKSHLKVHLEALEEEFLFRISLSAQALEFLGELENAASSVQVEARGEEPSSEGHYLSVKQLVGSSVCKQWLYWFSLVFLKAASSRLKTPCQPFPLQLPTQKRSDLSTIEKTQCIVQSL